MKIATIVARIVLGLIFFVFGLNGFFNFIPVPPMEGDAAAFMGLLIGSGYLYVVKILEVVGGALLLAGKKIPVALTLLGPVIVNIVLFHMFFAPSGIPLALVATLAELFLIWRHRSAFAPILRA